MGPGINAFFGLLAGGYILFLHYHPLPKGDSPAIFLVGEIPLLMGTQIVYAFYFRRRMKRDLKSNELKEIAMGTTGPLEVQGEALHPRPLESIALGVPSAFHSLEIILNPDRSPSHRSTKKLQSVDPFFMADHSGYIKICPAEAFCANGFKSQNIRVNSMDADQRERFQKILDSIPAKSFEVTYHPSLQHLICEYYVPIHSEIFAMGYFKRFDHPTMLPISPGKEALVQGELIKNSENELCLSPDTRQATIKQLGTPKMLEILLPLPFFGIGLFIMRPELIRIAKWLVSLI